MLRPGTFWSYGGAFATAHLASTLGAIPECAQKQPAGELDLAIGGASILKDGQGQLHDVGWTPSVADRLDRLTRLLEELYQARHAVEIANEVIKQRSGV